MRIYEKRCIDDKKNNIFDKNKIIMGVHTVYHNERKVVKDYREKGGMIFEGTCDYCGDTYYAKRRTATYCSKQCWTMAQKFKRIVLPDGRVRLEPISPYKMTKEAIEKMKKEQLEQFPAIKEIKKPRMTAKEIKEKLLDPEFLKLKQQVKADLERMRHKRKE